MRVTDLDNASDSNQVSWHTRVHQVFSCLTVHSARDPATLPLPKIKEIRQMYSGNNDEQMDMELIE